jgi:hypothetical protein
MEEATLTEMWYCNSKVEEIQKSMDLKVVLALSSVLWNLLHVSP